MIERELVMAFQFQGEQVCSRCGHRYEWMTTPGVESGEIVFYKFDSKTNNVKNCTRINNTNRYCIEVKCPECGKGDYIEETIA